MCHFLCGWFLICIFPFFLLFFFTASSTFYLQIAGILVVSGCAASRFVFYDRVALNSWVWKCLIKEVKFNFSFSFICLNRVITFPHIITIILWAIIHWAAARLFANLVGYVMPSTVCRFMVCSQRTVAFVMMMITIMSNGEPRVPCDGVRILSADILTVA